MATNRDHYRALGGSLGESYYNSATALARMEAGDYGAVGPRTIKRLRAAINKARVAFDAAEAALVAAADRAEDR